ncbi:hypothetical protein LTR84_013077 [Exophiala bonariae]|uniref:Xylanolytic transcriptional activator regulatory domain-containing protein n=1 Tax=Exophiala bonariae TaxID=1690606 RepID=A0AAV9NDM3_9EURO|nr:hypothetical protein LTR84_013077 [Exophiala bonariae]
MPCSNCSKRRTSCHFSQNKRRTRAPDEEGSGEIPSSAWLLENLPTNAPLASGLEIQISLENPEQSHEQPAWLNSISEVAKTPALARPYSGRIYMDEMLECEDVHGKEFHASLIPKSEKQNVSSSSLSLFSDSDIRSISEKLRNARFGELIESFSDSINKRLNRKANKSYPKVTFKKKSQKVTLSSEQRAEHVRCYFDHVHPLFPFLVRKDFEQQILEHGNQDLLEQDTPFYVLYHAIQATGSQYCGQGAFEPGIGKAWALFQTALDRLDELLGSRPCLESVQALLAMFVFSMTHCGGQIAETLLSEAARMAQFVRLNKGSSTLTAGAHQRTFWVVYSLEKLSCFCQGRTSSIPDDDIGCHIPHIPEAIFAEFNWFLSSVRLGRLVSKAQSALFSVSATMKLNDEYQQDLVTTRGELEAWRQSLPMNFRPGERFARAHFSSSTSVMAALRTHLVYHNFVMVLCRLTLQVVELSSGRSLLDTRQEFMNSARRVIELTGHIEVEPYAPSLLLTVIPLSAFLSLFHLVIDNPKHAETRDNLTFLDVAAGYFRRLEYATKQEFPFSIFPKLVSVAQEFVQKLPLAAATASAMEVETLPISEDEVGMGAGVELQTISGSGISVSPEVSFQAQNVFGEALYGMNGNIQLDQQSLSAEQVGYRGDGTSFTDNEVVDFFGNLLDGTCSSLYGTEFGWQ